MIDIQALKARFIDLAIRGKLVEQRPEEGTAADLLKEIEAEKALLIKEKKLKKNKPLPPIAEDEIPFEIPESWEWVRLSELVFNHGQKVPDQDFVYIEINSIDNTNQTLKSEENILSPDKAPSRARKIVLNGDIIYATVRPYLHNMCIIDGEFSKEPIASTGFAVMACHRNVYNKFLFYYLLSSPFDSYANSNDNSKGVAYPAINDERLYKAVIPVPPLSEQQRIVEKLESILSVLNSAEDSLNHSRSLAQKVREGILQLAIQGKLVEQRSEEGTAEDLLIQIQAEKAQLIKDKKLKKDKPLPPITEDEIPFEIPESWEWVRMSELSTSIRYGYTASAQMAGNAKLLRITDITSSGVNWDRVPFCDVNDVELDKFQLREGDIVIARTGGTIGKSFLVENVTANAVYASYLIDISSVSVIDHHYLKLYLDTPFYWEQLEEKSRGTGQPNVNAQSLGNLKIPLPPLSEQQRIVAKVEKIFSMLKVLEQS